MGGAQGRRFVIGIAGGSASGKSTFADALARAMASIRPESSVDILHADRYARPDAVDAPTFVSPSTGETRFNWNHPETIDNERLASEITDWREAQAGPGTLIVEGLMVLHVPAIRNLLDLKLFIDLDADVRALRRMLRDMRTKANRDPDYIAGYYLECARVGHAAYVEPSRRHCRPDTARRLGLRADSGAGRVDCRPRPGTFA